MSELENAMRSILKLVIETKVVRQNREILDFLLNHIKNNRLGPILESQFSTDQNSLPQVSKQQE